VPSITSTVAVSVCDAKSRVWFNVHVQCTWHITTHYTSYVRKKNTEKHKNIHKNTKLNLRQIYWIILAIVKTSSISAEISHNFPGLENPFLQVHDFPGCMRTMCYNVMQYHGKNSCRYHHKAFRTETQCCWDDVINFTRRQTVQRGVGRGFQTNVMMVTAVWTRDTNDSKQNFATITNLQVSAKCTIKQTGHSAQLTTATDQIYEYKYYSKNL